MFYTNRYVYLTMENNLIYCLKTREMNIQILQLTKSGQPISWLNREDAATLYAKERVLWELGDKNIAIIGGVNRQGLQSRFDMAPIIACDSEKKGLRMRPALSNRLLFRRDDYRCLYCGVQFDHDELTRDHVIPRTQGGLDRWENVVAACKRCNHGKGGRTPEQAGVKLLAIPFVPNPFEFLYLANRHILADQMEYLASSFSSKRDWLQAA